MRPKNILTKIFLDGGDPEETRQLLAKLGFLDGQTTNPTLISKNPEARRKLAAGIKFSAAEILRFYRGVVQKISDIIPGGSISVEVYADKNTTAREMLAQGKEMYRWIPNAHIKFPVTRAGLFAAAELVKEGGRVNLTLCFSEEQAAAVYAATRGAERGRVFVSPFIGRLDDLGENGMDLIENILRLYSESDHHVEVLAASVRSQEHFLRALQLRSDIITAPLEILGEWAVNGSDLPDSNFVYKPGKLKPIAYRPLDLDKSWQTFNLDHPLTIKGIERFSTDWNALIAA